MPGDRENFEKPPVCRQRPTLSGAAVPPDVPHSRIEDGNQFRGKRREWATGVRRLEHPHQPFVSALRDRELSGASVHQIGQVRTDIIRGIGVPPVRSVTVFRAGKN